MFRENECSKNVNVGNTGEELLSETPPHSKNEKHLENLTQDSPSFFPSTQDENAVSMDVLWDWNSPRAPKSHKHEKQMNVSGKKLFHSPLRKDSARNKFFKSDCLQSIHNIKEKLEELNNQINSRTSDVSNQPSQAIFQLGDLIQDTFCQEEIDLICTQFEESTNNNAIVIEGVLEKTQLPANDSTSKQTINNLDSVTSLDDSGLFLKPKSLPTQVGDLASKSIQDDKKFSNSQAIVINCPKTSITTVNSNVTKNLGNLQMNHSTSPSRLQRKYKSFNDLSSHQSKCSPAEIERKRLEALAKREGLLKKNVQNNVINHTKNATSVFSQPKYELTSATREPRNGIPTKSTSKSVEAAKSLNNPSNSLPKLDQLKYPENKSCSRDCTSPSRMHRKHKSFQDAFTNNSKCTPEEIERKRREALAKREKNIVDPPNVCQQRYFPLSTKQPETSRRFERNHSFDANATSSLVLSQELKLEIDKKRREALEKLDQKRKQEEIQRKKREALARLEKTIKGMT